MKIWKSVVGFVAGTLTIAVAVAACWALLSLVGALAERLGATHKAWNPAVELLGEHYWALGLGAVFAVVMTCTVVLAVVVWIVIPVSEFGQGVLSLVRRRPK